MLKAASENVHKTTENNVLLRVGNENIPGTPQKNKKKIVCVVNM